MTTNPFEYDAAPNLPPERLVEWYIEDDNYARFMKAHRNVVINGERGSGKSMTLIYHSMSYDTVKERSGAAAADQTRQTLGIYVPCNTPLNSKDEHLLLDEIAQRRISEADLTLMILANLAREFEASNIQFDAEDLTFLREEFEITLDCDPFPDDVGPFVHLRREVRRKLKLNQQQMLDSTWNPSASADTFSIMVIPVLEAIAATKSLSGVHFSLLIDDAQNLNSHQRKLLNSWLGYRDNSLFSFKIAIAGVRGYDFATSSGGIILDGHDYTTVDLQRPIQNKDSEFGRFARNVVEKRLRNAGISLSPDEFFPVDPSTVKRLEQARRVTENNAIERGLERGSKAFNDYVYKHRRAVYFRSRTGKANKPIYSGFNTMAHLSTGVIRNLLEPCYVMFERQASSLKGKTPANIKPDVQDTVIKELSDRRWDMMSGSLHRILPNCSAEDGQAIHNLFTRVAEYFRRRLLEHASEPRVVTFIISERGHPASIELKRLLDLSERAQLLYVRAGTSKKGGGREDYYVPNRMLWARYGLDAHGQHGRASLRAEDLLAAAQKDIAIPFPSGENDPEPSENQGTLFDGER